MGGEDCASTSELSALKGGLLVPLSFVVPSGDERWPSVTWGYKLGRAVSNLRTKLENNVRLPSGMQEELGKLSIADNVPQFKWDNIILPALWQFRKVYGHVDVPYLFVVPVVMRRGQSWHGAIDWEAHSRTFGEE